MATPTTPHFRALQRLAATQGGYFYPWRSSIAAGDGETAYGELLGEHLNQARGDALDALEAGCGHGVDVCRFAPRLRSLLAYDAVEEFIAIAKRAADAAGLTNVTFVTADSSAKRNAGRVCIPAPDDSVDLIFSRRGPTNWILDARRVCRPGAVLLQLNPLTIPVPEWNEELPPALRMTPAVEPIPEKVEDQLDRAGIAQGSCWTFDVAESFDDARQLYLMLTWMRDPNEVPAFETCAPELERMIAGRGGVVAIRNRRYLWKAVV